jgi:hypothetical protein
VRASFLILLLANILFLAWSLWVATPASSALPSAPASDPRSMHLVGEAPKGDEVGAPVGPDRTAGAAAANCVSFGPFVDDAALAAANDRLQSLGYEATRRVSTEEVPAGQRVSVSNLATPEDAANALNALRAAGLADAYVVTGTGPGITVSVGVFNDPTRAGEAADAVRRAGLEPRVTDRTRTADVSWLDVDRRSNAGLPDLADVRESSAPAVDMRACPAAG